MGRIIGDIYRALELAFREQLDGFTRCPACNGCGVATNTSSVSAISKPCHSLNLNQACWFCEGHGLLPLTRLRGLPPIRTERYSTASFFKPSTYQISYSTQIKLQPHMGTKWCLFCTLKCPARLLVADTQFDAASSVLHAKKTKFQDMSLRPCPLQTTYQSVVLLISVLSSAISSNYANAQASSANYPLGIASVKKEDNGLDSDAVLHNGKELGGYWNPRAQKRRNHLREKAAEKAERRGRSILMALVPSEPERTSGNNCTS